MHHSTGVLIMIVGFAMLGPAVAGAWAAEEAGEPVVPESAEPAVPAAVEPQAPAGTPATAPEPAVTPAPQRPKTPADDVRTQLDGTQWDVEIVPLGGGEKAKPKKDTLSFKGRQLSSAWLSKEGYPDSNFSLTIGDDGTVIWETMQTKEGAGVVFWRGELSGSRVQGVLSKRPVEGASEDYSFHGSEQGGKAISVSPDAGVQAAGVAASQAPAAQPVQEEAAQPSPRKKKKSRFGR